VPNDQGIRLRCPNCGANLQIFDDMSRFACAYCGSEQIVERRGGTVSLKLIAEAISKVQRGTDKTAAELALTRLERELEQLLKVRQQRKQEIESKVKERSDGGTLTFVLVFIGTGAIIGPLFRQLFGESGDVPAFFIALILGVISLGIRYLKVVAPFEELMDRELKGLDLPITAVQKKIQDNRKVADS